MSLYRFPLVALFAMLPATAQAAVDFAHEVVPILKQYCGKCHTGDSLKGKLSFNTRETLLAGGESGKSVIPGQSAQSELIKRILTKDEFDQMPPEGPRVPPEKIAILQKWIDEGVAWEQGLTLGKRSYEPPLKPRRPTLPAAVDNRENPVDRILDHYLATRKLPRPAGVDDAVFIRRASMDIIGLLPTPEELDTFLKDTRPDKRQHLVRELLSRDVDYAENWLTFWNDLLRNDYSGTGFITGGRKQVSKWLYDALVQNKPYDQFARELIAPPTPESAGFIQGIQWRGDVSAGQTVEIQFAQSITQTFLGINLKCASCHDSFIDRWTLEEAFNLAAVYSNRPLELHRCDKPTGKMAKAGWLFPELGTIDAAAPQAKRLSQLADLMTHADNGRFTRTIVNRLWHRLMGRGIVHPVDAMQTEPWNADLLDHLAVDLVDQKYDLKKTIELIVTSQAYQSAAQVMTKGVDDAGYIYAGPRGKRLTAEQFMDSVWQLTGAAPRKIDAPITRASRPAAGPAAAPAAPAPPTVLTAKWIWSQAQVNAIPDGATVIFRRELTLGDLPKSAIAAITCDNGYTLFINGKRITAGDNWEAPDSVPLLPHLRKGKNELIIVAVNGGNSPNPAALFFEARLIDAAGKVESLASDDQWEWTVQRPDANGRFRTPPRDWKKAVPVSNPGTWARVNDKLLAALGGAGGSGAGSLMVRAALLKADPLMRALGRPNRDQIVTERPADLTTLEAFDLSNGQILADMIAQGARELAGRNWENPQALTRWLYRHALSREPTPQELRVIGQALGNSLTQEDVEDVIWSVIMLPEFQMVR